MCVDVVAGGVKGGGCVIAPMKKRESARAKSGRLNNVRKVACEVIRCVGPGQGGALMGRVPTTWGVGLVVICVLSTKDLTQLKLIFSVTF